MKIIDLASSIWGARLHLLGYLADAFPSLARLKDALAAFQERQGLPATGELDAETHRVLFAPRFCGHPDIMPLATEVRRWPGTNPTITWSLMNTAPGMAPELTVEAFQWAWAQWAQWAQVCAIQPVYSRLDPAAKVQIQFQDVDGPWNVLAYSELADGTDNPKGQAYDVQEAWVYSANPPQQAIDLARVAAHEIGHALGLDHLPAGNLMQSLYDMQIRSPQAGDIAAVVAVYGIPTAPPPAPTPPPSGAWEIKLTGTGPIESVSVPGFRIAKLP